MNRTTIIGITLSAFALLACDKEPTADSAKPDAAVTQTSTGVNNPSVGTTPVVAAPIVLSDSDLVTAADFEDEAEKSITSKNYKAELASLETELTKD